MITRDCPTGLRALRRRASRIAAALLTAFVSLPALAFGGRTQGSKVKLRVERVASSSAAVFDGVVDASGSPLPGVTVTVRNESTKSEVTAVTDVNGAFRIVSLSDGLYRVNVTLESFRPATIKHLQLKAGEVTHAKVE
ncbi:MAG TPA: carboxypeptidase-like regulatory domain-containing protein, partial [Thermoanaerobaculia bacterium]|nr:carboxypeptidase-like regulatory domain-containing protein [Thermoanaerobaculia bacterium]